MTAFLALLTAALIGLLALLRKRRALPKTDQKSYIEAVTPIVPEPIRVEMAKIEAAAEAVQADTDAALAGEAKTNAESPGAATDALNEAFDGLRRGGS